MKNLVHCFSPGIVSAFLDTFESNSTKRFELIAALVMARLYREQWNCAVMIGFYMKSQQHLDLARNAQNASSELLIDALKNGIENNNPVDFILFAADQSAYQEFQLKRFGMTGLSTEGLIDYLNAMKAKYAPVDAACLVWITDFEMIDFPKVNSEIERKGFPFTELLFFGVVKGGAEIAVVGILPNSGWSVFDLTALVAG